jgi:hypothetical protein
MALFIAIVIVAPIRSMALFIAIVIVAPIRSFVVVCFEFGFLAHGMTRAKCWFCANEQHCGNYVSEEHFTKKCYVVSTVSIRVNRNYVLEDPDVQMYGTDPES